MLTVKPKFEAKGKFKIERTGPSGHLIHEQENLVTDQMLTSFFYDGSNAQIREIFNIADTYLNIGDGNAEPKTSDTSLTNLLWRIKVSDCSVISNEDFNIAQITLTGQIPSTSSYVGTIRELGISGYASSWLYTHALLKDAEGHPYEIVKTDLDQVTIIYTIFISMDVYTLCSFAFSKAFSVITGSYSASSPGISLLYQLQQYEIYNKCFYTNSEVYIIAKNSNNVQRDKNTKKAIIPVFRMNAAHTYNGHYILVVAFTSCIPNNAFMHYINLPNLEIMPQAKLEDYSVGIGDGQNTEFTPPIPLWDEGTEEIYVNGILQQPNIDYTCDYKHNLQNNFELFPLAHALILQDYDKNNSIPITISSTTIPFTFLTNSILYSYVFDNTFTKQRVGYLANDGGEIIFSLPIEYDFINWDIEDIYFATNSNSNQYQAFFTLDVSEDLQNWESIFTELPAKKGTRTYAHNRPLSDWDTHHLEQSIKKKYWKFKISGTLMPSDRIGFFLMPTKGEPIKFTKAPEEDAIITMNAKSSLPYKDDKHIIDYSGVVQL